jgi:DNA-directed RNA polymerase subunit M/transcription elongation factor TFIIS
MTGDKQKVFKCSECKANSDNFDIVTNIEFRREFRKGIWKRTDMLLLHQRRECENCGQVESGYYIKKARLLKTWKPTEK